VANLLERDDALDVLTSAVTDAEAGRGSVVLLFGEAGIGKTSVVRAFCREVSGHARVLLGACDDLLAPRTLGPLHDVVGSAGTGPLAAALRGGRDAVLNAVREELSDPHRPTVLVVEDAHWADEATLDVLRFIGRRIADLRAVLLVTYRDDEVGPDLLQRVLGGLSGPSVRRVPLRPLSRDAVARWAGGTSITTAHLYQLTEGNPFFVSEVLADVGAAVPPTVADAVLARMRRLDESTQRGLEQLAVVPSQVELPLARALLGDVTVLGEAERSGMLEVRSRAVAFRHELARRAVEDSLPTSERMRCNGLVLAALLERAEPDLARVVHHAVQAGDDTAVVTHAPEAARRAVQAGAQRQAASHYEQVLRRADLLTVDDHAATAEAYAWTQYHCDCPPQGVAAGREAVRLREAAGDVEALATALASLSVLQWADMRIPEALTSGERAVQLLETRGDSVQRVYALTFLGTLLVNIDREPEALVVLDQALAMAERTGFHHFDAVIRIFRGRSLLQLGDGSGLVECDRGLQLARATGDHQSVMIGYLNVVCALSMLGRHREMLRYLDEGAAYGQDREFRTLDLNREMFRHKLQIQRGEWDRAEAGLSALRGDPEVENGLARFAMPELARLAVRRGQADAPTLLAAARAIADRAGSSYTSVVTSLAELEHAWSDGRPDVVAAAVEAATVLLAQLDRAGHERNRGEVLRWLRRLGRAVQSFDGCPTEFATGLEGDWPAAVIAWERVGAPYERALELAESGVVERMVEALEIFDGLGAAPALAWTRRRLRERGVRRIARGPQAATRANHAGLTDRQLQILRLVGEGRTNAEIAAALVLSVRTVDHHVSAVLQKLGVTSRREAAVAVAELQ
jgi:DNA-binding CsgD family transcriptional regulator/tetratricopeptide (TPR) repeat protein